MDNLAQILQRHITSLEKMTSSPDKGVTRLIYSEQEREAKAYIREWMDVVGLDIHEDEFGNLFGTWVGRQPELGQVWIGSHLDAPLCGGSFDGVAGVITALEAIHWMKRTAATPERSIVLVIFAGEEPTRFGIGCLGSRVLTGELTARDLHRFQQEDNTTLYKVLESMGRSPELIASQVIVPETIERFIELHIEQGPVLEDNQVLIGIVQQIAAPAEIEMVFSGRQCHAGATPMSLRLDPVPAACEFTVEVEKLMRAHDQDSYVVGTVGRMIVEPNASNVIASEVKLSVDIRSTSDEDKDMYIQQILTMAERIATSRGVSLRSRILGNDHSLKMDEKGVAIIQEIANEMGVTSMRLPSGAYHDALIMARKVRTNMIFLPSRDGISHTPVEWTELAHLVVGTELLFRLLKLVSRRSD